MRDVRFVSRFLRTGLAFLLLLGTAWTAQAQGQQGQGQSDQQTADDPQLPEIAPREIEIRGELQINFPALERQPLTGFAPSASVPALPADHLPSTEPYKQELDDLPQSVPEMEPVSTQLEAAPDPASGLLEAGGGRYFHRFVRGRLYLPVSRTETFTIEGDYDGLSGHEPFADRSIDTPYDRLEGAVRFASRRSRFGVNVGVHGFFDDYTLYGATPATPSVLRAPERTAGSGGASASFRLRGAVPVSLSIAYDQTQYDTQLRPDSLANNTLSFDEGRLSGTGSIEFPVGPSTASLRASASTAGLDGGSAFDGDVATFDGSGRILLLQQGAVSLEAGARFLSFTAEADPSRPRPGEASANYVAPVVRAEWAVSPSFTVFAHNLPRLVPHDLATLYGRNPFLDHAPSLRPTLETTRAESGVELTTGPLRLTAQAGFRYAPVYLYFAPSDGPTSGSSLRDGVFGAFYDSAQIIHGGGSIALHGLDRVQASVGVSVRDGQLTGPDTAIPNFAPLTVDGMVTFSFAEDRGFLKLTTNILSPRFIDTRENAEVGTYADVDLEGSFEVSPLLDVVAKLENIGAMERWNRYPRPPAVLSAGLRIHW